MIATRSSPGWNVYIEESSLCKGKHRQDNCSNNNSSSHKRQWRTVMTSNTNKYSLYSLFCLKMEKKVGSPFCCVRVTLVGVRVLVLLLCLSLVQFCPFRLCLALSPFLPPLLLLDLPSPHSIPTSIFSINCNLVVAIVVVVVLSHFLFSFPHSFPVTPL